MSRFNLPVFKQPAAVLTPAQLIRRTINADASADSILGDTTALDFGLAIYNPELPTIRAANQITDVALPPNIPPADAFAQVEALYAAKNSKCLKWILTPASSEPDPIATFLAAQHWRPRTFRFYALQHTQPIPTRDDLTLIPARASFAKLRELIAITSAADGNPDPLLPLVHERRFDDTHLDGFLALLGTDPVGIVTLYTDSDSGYLADLHVHPDHRRHKIGATLLMRAIELAARSRHRHVTLYTDHDNAPAIALYERAGFTALGTTQAYYRPQ